MTVVAYYNDKEMASETYTIAKKEHSQNQSNNAAASKQNKKVEIWEANDRYEAIGKSALYIY